MTLRNRGTPTGFSRWVAAFMAYAMRHANRKDSALLERIVEGCERPRFSTTPRLQRPHDRCNRPLTSTRR